MDERSDDDLLAATRAEPEAFAVFYRRHVQALLAYFARRTRDAELAADLTAETFAAALERRAPPPPREGTGDRLAVRDRAPPARACRSQGRGRGPRPAAARHGPADAHRRGARAGRGAGHRRRLRAAPSKRPRGAPARPARSRPRPRPRRAGLRGDRDRARTSESVVRKRVSRGLAGLRSRLEGQ